MFTCLLRFESATSTCRAGSNILWPVDKGSERKAQLTEVPGANDQDGATVDQS